MIGLCARDWNGCNFTVNRIIVSHWPRLLASPWITRVGSDDANSIRWTFKSHDADFKWKTISLFARSQCDVISIFISIQYNGNWRIIATLIVRNFRQCRQLTDSPYRLSSITQLCLCESRVAINSICGRCARSRTHSTYDCSSAHKIWKFIQIIRVCVKARFHDANEKQLNCAIESVEVKGETFHANLFRFLFGHNSTRRDFHAFIHLCF